MDRLLPDVTHAVRRLLRAPGFAAIAILTLALGIGANTAIFSLVKTVILRPLPYGEPDRLVMLWRTADKGESTWLSSPEVTGYSGATRAFERVDAYYGTVANLTGGMEPERVNAAFVTPGLFRALGVPALVGRTFEPGDSAATIADQVVLGHALWQRRLGGRPDVVGQTIQVNGSARTIIGVMPPSFKLPRDFGSDRPSELWTAYDLAPTAAQFGNRSLIAFARMRDGVDPDAATSAMRAIESRWYEEGHWQKGDETGLSAVPMRDFVIGDVRTALWILLGAVGVILLIACANVANLMLARGDERQREVAVRAALGASRGRIMSQLLTESVVIAVVGGALGTGLAYGGLRVLQSAQPAGIPRIDQIGIDVGVFGFTLVLTVITGLVFGLAPALELSRPDLTGSIKDGGRTGSSGVGRQRFRDGLAVAQMAFSVVLLVGAMLLIRSFVQLRGVDLGFEHAQALTARVALPAATYPNDTAVIAFHRTLRQRFAELPGVTMVGATRLLPLTGTIGDWTITVEGRATAPTENPNGDWQVVTPGYFEAMGMKIREGRGIAESDHERAPIVAVVNETMAKKYWPDGAIGKRFHIGTLNQPWITIVGVIGQVRHNAVTETPRAEMYVPHAQWGAAGASASRGLTYVVRTTGNPLGVLGYVRQTVRSLDPNLPIADVQTLDTVMANSLAQARFTTTLLGLFAALALTLASIGIYGVIALLVSRRRQEIGIRIALGAKPRSILAMVVRRGMALAAAGVALGLAGALALGSVLNSMLFGVTRFDPLTFAAVPALLGAVALVACAIPAGRAANVSPMVALREE
jgi:putative ABC transport system permease protein